MSEVLIILGGFFAAVLVVILLMVFWFMLEERERVAEATDHAPVTIPLIISTVIVIGGLLLVVFAPMQMLMGLGLILLLGMASGLIFALTKFVQVLWLQIEDSPRIQRILNALSD